MRLGIVRSRPASIDAYPDGVSLPVSLADVLDANARTTSSRIHTSLPGKVVAYNPATNTADIQICVKAPFFDLDGGREYDEMPTLPSVPIIWPRGGGFVMTLPIGPGDFVWLMFSELALAEWRSTGQLSEPTDARRHSLGYPYAIPGAFPDTSPMAALDATARAAKAIFGNDGGVAIHIDGTTIKLNPLAIDAVALATPTQAGLAACMAAANATLSTLASAISTFNSHTHSGVTAGAGVTGPPAASMSAAGAPGGAPGAVAALTVKAL